MLLQILSRSKVKSSPYWGEINSLYIVGSDLNRLRQGDTHQPLLWACSVISMHYAMHKCDRSRDRMWVNRSWCKIDLHFVLFSCQEYLTGTCSQHSRCLEGFDHMTCSPLHQDTASSMNSVTQTFWLMYCYMPSPVSPKPTYRYCLSPVLRGNPKKTGLAK